MRNPAWVYPLPRQTQYGIMNSHEVYQLPWFMMLGMQPPKFLWKTFVFISFQALWACLAGPDWGEESRAWVHVEIIPNLAELRKRLCFSLKFEWIQSELSITVIRSTTWQTLWKKTQFCLPQCHCLWSTALADRALSMLNALMVTDSS